MFDEHQLNQLYRYSLALTNQDSLAYDLVHEAIIKIDGRKIQNAMAYAKTIIRNSFYDTFKAKKELPINLDDDTAAEEISIEKLLIHRDQIETVLNQLTPADRELLFLISVEEYSYKEAAESMGAKVGTLLSRMHRIKSTLSEKNEVNE